MNKIAYLQHCTNLTTIIKILKDGYIRSAKDVQSNHVFTMHNSNISKIFLQIVFNHIRPLNYDKCCILINKNILINRKDYGINPTGMNYYLGKNSIYHFNYNKNIDKINPKTNEVLFYNKISIKKYLKGFKFMIYTNDYRRLDYIHKYNFSDYFINIKKNKYINDYIKKHKIYDKKLKSVYQYNKKILNKLLKYSNNFIFDKYNINKIYDNKLGY